jgi:hypothetical protein
MKNNKIYIVYIGQSKRNGMLIDSETLVALYRWNLPGKKKTLPVGYSINFRHENYTHPDMSRILNNYWTPKKHFDTIEQFHEWFKQQYFAYLL